MRQGERTNNPAEGIGVYLVTAQSVQRGLTADQVTALLDLADTTSLMGKRDYVLLSFLLQLGLSYADCVALSVGDVILADGHVTALRLGEDKERLTVKLSPPLAQALSAYADEAGIAFAAGDAPILGSLATWGHHLASSGKRITSNSVARILRSYAQRLGPQVDKTVLLATVATAATASRSRLNQAQPILGRAIIDARRGR